MYIGGKALAGSPQNTGATAHAADARPSKPQSNASALGSDRGANARPITTSRARTVNEMFRTFANGTAKVMGSPWTFFTAVLLIVVWGCSFRLFVHPGVPEDQWKRGFDTWQLVINTGTTIVTFLMVFLIQNTQNRDAQAMHLKLDELIRAMKGPATSWWTSRT